MTTIISNPTSEKSTTDRVFALARTTPRRSLGAVLPTWLSARWAAHLFATPRSFERPDAEELFLLKGRPFRVHGLAAWRWGSGPSVFLMHGWEGRGGQLGAFVEPLVASGYSVIAFDAPAHGASPGMEATLSDFAESLLALERRVGPPAAVIAHSFGTLATLLAVRRGLSARAIVLIAVPSPRDRLSLFLDAMKLPDAAATQMKSLVEKRVGIPFSAVEGPALAAGVDVPVLVVHDRQDREVPIAGSEATAAALSRSVFRLTDGLGHRRILKDPQIVDDISSFVVLHAPSSARVTMSGSAGARATATEPSRRRHLPVLASPMG
jgi:pimeloyl-ACP methyl ester carboxylesterase